MVVEFHSLVTIAAYYLSFSIPVGLICFLKGTQNTAASCCSPHPFPRPVLVPRGIQGIGRTSREQDFLTWSTSQGCRTQSWACCSRSSVASFLPSSRREDHISLACDAGSSLPLRSSTQLDGSASLRAGCGRA